MASFSSHLLLLCSVALLLRITCSSTGHASSVKVVDLERPIAEFTPSHVLKYSLARDSKDTILCERVRVAGISRWRIGSYASSFQVTLVPSVEIPERLHNKIMVCSHMNASVGLCECEQHEWKAVQKGLWSSVVSPYDDVYVDVKVLGEVPGFVTLSVEEELHQWRFYCLALGFAFLLLAPIVSSWVPFYYSSSMVIGVLLVVLILLFQAMKLLPGRKNLLYIFMSGPVLGVGSLILYYFSALVNSVLASFGLSEEMHHLVSIFVLIGITLAGAGLGYWLVRKFVISEDGTVDIGVAQFVKWAMRVVAATLYSQSTHDKPLALVAFIASCIICCLISKWQELVDYGNDSPWVWKSRDQTLKRHRAEFRSRTPKLAHRGTVLNSQKISHAWSNSPVRGVVSPSSGSGTGSEQDYYSTFHKTPKRRKFSRKEWNDSKRESTREALADLTASPEFLSWMVNNAERIQVIPDDSSDGTIESGSDSTEETALQSGNRRKLWNW